MKKIFLIMTVLACFITSCSNEDIDITYSGGLTINVSTQSTYDDFGITQDIKEKVLSNGYNIGIYNFLYDKEGLLIASDTKYSRTFDMISVNFDKLLKGSYTLITLEMVVNPDDNYKSRYWTIEGENDIKTVEIKSKYSTVYYQGIVGLSTREINIDGTGSQTIPVTPRGIGSLINIWYENFGKSPFNRVAFYTKDGPVGRYLSPFYTGTDRFEDDEYNPNKTWTSRGYIYEEGGLNNDLESNIYLIEEGTIKYCYGPSTLTNETDQIRFTSYPSNGADFNISDGSTYWGSLWYKGGSPSCESCLLNSEADLVDWMLRMENAQNTILAPYLTWGGSASSVDSYMKEKGAILSDSGTNIDEGIYWTFYENFSGNIYYEYQFDSSKTNLNAVFMTFMEMTLDQVRAYLSQSFTEEGYNEELGGYLYSSDKTALLITEEEEGSYVQVLFVPNVEESAVRSKGFKYYKDQFSISKFSFK